MSGGIFLYNHTREERYRYIEKHKQEEYKRVRVKDIKNVRFVVVCVCVCVCVEQSGGGGGRVMIINGGEKKGEDQRIRASKGKLTFLGGRMAIADLGVSERW